MVKSQKQLLPLKLLLSVLLALLLSTLFTLPLAASTSVNAKDPLSQELSSLDPVQAFYRLPAFAHPVISPLGDKIAFQTIYKGQVLLVTRTLGEDGKTFNGKTSAIKAGEFSVQDYVWANNDRLIVQARTFISNWDNHVDGTLLIAINYDGSDALFLPMEPDDYIRSWYRRNVFLPAPRIVEPLVNDKEHVLAELDIALTQGFYVFPKVHRVNIYTGEKTLLQKNKRQMWRWFADTEGHLRIGERVDFDSATRYVRLYHSTPNSKTWEVQQKINNNSAERLYPYRMSKEDARILLVRKEESVDHLTNRFAEDHLLKYDTLEKKLVGPYVNALRKEATDFAKAQFPGRQVDVSSMDWHEQKAVVNIYSDIEPPSYFVYHRAEKSLQFLSAGFPVLKQVPLNKMQKLSYQSRDGANISAYLTLPEHRLNSGSDRAGADTAASSAKRKPAAIILPHDGPASRDYWGFNRYVQFFSSMGYAVFQPQYRGSTGFGAAYKSAGNGQWGLRMQDDVSDGVKWLADSGMIDPNKICIVGRGYAGYVAALELAKNGAMYQCGISMDGVLNLKKYLERFKYTSLVETADIFDKGFAKAGQYSPTDLVDDIQSPMLLIASERNVWINTKFSRLMNKRMKKKNKTVTYVELKGAEYWETNNSHELKRFTAIAEFLKTHMPSN